LALDNAGTGGSYVPESIWFHSIETMVRDVISLTKYLKWDAFHVVGVSMGGMISLELACRYTIHVKSLTLINTHAGGIRTNFFPPFGGAYLLIRAILTKDVEKRRSFLRKLLYCQRSLNDPDKLKILTDFRTNVIEKAPLSSFKGVLSQLLAINKHWISSPRLLYLKRTGIPALVIVGTEDCLVHPRNSYYIQQQLNCELLEVEAGHGIPSECSDFLNHNLQRHILNAEKKSPTVYRGINSFRDYRLMTVFLIGHLLSLPTLLIICYCLKHNLYPSIGSYSTTLFSRFFK